MARFRHCIDLFDELLGEAWQDQHRRRRPGDINEPPDAKLVPLRGAKRCHRHRRFFGL